MALVRRRERPPADLLAQLDHDERVVSWAADDVGQSVVATTRALWWPGPHGWRRIGWHLIDKATWRDGTLTVIEADVVDGMLLVDRRPVAVRLEHARDLPPTVRSRIEASVVRSEVQSLAIGSARFVARRISGVDGVSWWARLEDGTPDTPAVRDEVRARLDQLEQSWRVIP